MQFGASQKEAKLLQYKNHFLQPHYTKGERKHNLLFPF